MLRKLLKLQKSLQDGVNNMTALVITAFTLVPIGCGLLVSSVNAYSASIYSNEIRKLCIKGIIGVFLIILAITLSVAIPVSCANRLTENTYCLTSDDAEIKIYQDCNTGEYFRLRNSDWDLFNPHYRQYIDTEEAAELIEAINYIDKWEDKYD